MNEQNNKDELIQLIEDSDLDSTSEAYLKHKLDLNRITEKEKLEKEITIEKRKTEMRKIVEEADLDYTSKSNLFYKIQQNFILREYELKKEFAMEKRKNEIIMNKNEFEKIVEDSCFDTTSNSDISYKTNKEITTAKDEFNEERRIEEIKKELRNIVMKDNLYFSSKRILINKIEHNEIINKEDLEIEIHKEKTEKGTFIYPFEERIMQNKRLEEILKEEKEEERRKRLREIVSNANLDSTSRLDLFNKINKGEIRTENQLIEEIENEKRKTEFEKIVETNDLDHTSKSELFYKINTKRILTKNQLIEEIENEKRKTEMRKKQVKKVKIGYYSNHDNEVLLDNSHYLGD